MKFSTANIKNTDYNEPHVIYVGTQIGSLKSKKNLSNIKLFENCFDIRNMWNLG